jgi:hypothetical protein
MCVQRAGESILAVIEAQNIEFNASHARTSTGNILTAWRQISS